MNSRRLGLGMIGAALLVAVLVAALLLEREAATRAARQQSQGLGLVRLLSGMPAEQLLPRAGHAGALQSVLQSLGGDIGYGIVESVAGETMVEIGAVSAALVPKLPSPADPASWPM